jgi:hypothetical protein
LLKRKQVKYYEHLLVILLSIRKDEEKDEQELSSKVTSKLDIKGREED